MTLMGIMLTEHRQTEVKQMKRIHKAGLTGVLLGTLTLGSFPAFAQDVTIVGLPVTLSVYDARESGTAVDKEADHFRIFGQAGEDMLLIRIGEEDEYVKIEDLKEALPELDCEGFPLIDEVVPVEKGHTFRGNKALQEMLVSLGLMDEKQADGIYGEQTRVVIRTFQEEHGLEATGNADLYTTLLIMGLASGKEDMVEISNNSFATPEEKFEAIAGRTEDGLTPFLDTEWRFQYDPFTETGTIDPSFVVGSFEVDGPDIDRIRGDLSVKVIVEKNSETGSFELTPAFVLETVGAYRPYLQGMLLAGKDALRLDGGKSIGQVEGVLLREFGYVPLTFEAAEQLKSGDVSQIRVLGKNTSYDLDVNMNMDQAGKIIEACETLITE